MFWILGAEGLFAALFVITGLSFFELAASEMLHSKWHGFTFYDLIFPLFILLSGVSLGIAAKPISSYSKTQQREKYRHAIKRLALLVGLGIVYNHGWGTGMPAAIDDIRYASVLGKIGLAWFVGAMLVWHCQVKTQAIVTAALFFGYWLMLAFVSIDGYGAGNYGPTHSLNAWVDQTFLPGIRYQNLAVDPEGILSNLGSVINGMVGVFVGRLMMTEKHLPKVLLRNLVLIGIIALASGWLLHTILPVNKTLWTPSFVLVTSGWSVLFLAFFYYLIDMQNWQAWAKPFAIIGMNSIIIYLATSLVKWDYIANSLFGGFINALSAPWQALWAIIAVLALQWLLLAWMFKHKIFIKV